MLIKIIKFNVILTLVLGITSVILSFFNFYAIYVGVFCIIISIFLFKRHKIVILSIMLSILGIVVSIVFIINKKDPNYLLGMWNCRIFNTDNEYILTFKIEDDNNYFWGKYGDLDNNYVIGKYELKKKNNTDDSIIYELKLNSSNYIENGSMKNEIINYKYEISLNKNNMKQILLKKDKSDVILDCRKD